MNNKTTNLVLLSASILLLFVHHCVSYIGHFGYDDMEYARMAFQLSNGIFETTNHYTFRLTLVGLTSLFYSLFGINDFSSSLPSLLAASGILVLLYRLLRHKPWPITAIALSLTALSFWFLFYSDKLMPDVPMAFFAFGYVVSLYQYRIRQHTTTTARHAVASAIWLFLCFNTKENVVMLLPLIGWYFVADMIQKKHTRYWVLFSATGIGLLAIYLLFLHATCGDALTRFKSIINNSYLNLCSYDQQPFIITLRRIGYYIWKEFLIQGMFTAFLFVLAFLPFGFKNRVATNDDTKSFWVTASILLMLSANFMTISWKAYVPMCVDPRHYLFLVPVHAVAASLIWYNQRNNRKFVGMLLGLSIIAFMVSVTLRSNSAWLLYLPLALLFTLNIAFAKKQWMTTLFPIVLVVALIARPVQMAVYVHSVKYSEQKRIVVDEILEKRRGNVVVTDEVQKRLAQYFDKFSNSTVFLNYSEAMDYPTNGNDSILHIFNPHTQNASGYNPDNLPMEAKLSAQNPFYESTKPNIKLCHWIGANSATVVLQTQITFDEEVAGWENTSNTTEEPAFSKPYSQKLTEYSATYSVPIDSMIDGKFHSLVVQANAMIYTTDQTRCCLVLSIKTGNDNYFWKGVPIEPYLKSFGNWHKVTFTELFKPEDIKPGSILSLYFWNIEKDEVYLDNFGIQLAIQHSN